jgi:hypothetical protein
MLSGTARGSLLGGECQNWANTHSLWASVKNAAHSWLDSRQVKSENLPTVDVNAEARSKPRNCRSLFRGAKQDSITLLRTSNHGQPLAVR